MATFTSSIRLEKQDNGSNSGSWGTVLNANVIDLVDSAIAGYTIVSCSSADITLSSSNGSADQARSAILELQGTLTSNVVITIPAVSKIYFVKNSTSGSYSVTLKTSGNSGKAITQGGTTGVICNAVTVTDAVDTTGLGLGTASTLNFGTAAGNLIPVSSADIRYIPTSTSSTISSNKVFSGTVITSGTATFTSATTFSAAISAASSTTFAGAVGTPEVSIASATSMNVDFSNGNNFAITLGTNATLAGAVNGKVGQSGTITITQDGTGSRTLSYGASYNFSGGTAPTLSTAAAAKDIIVYKVREVSSIDCASILNLS